MNRARFDDNDDYLTDLPSGQAGQLLLPIEGEEGLSVLPELGRRECR